MKKFHVTEYELNINKPSVTAGRVRAAFLTDLHNTEIGPENTELLRAIHEAQPDLILSGGDLIVGKPGYSPEIARKLILELLKDYPVYHALGNHEYRARIYPDVYGTLYTDYTEPLIDAGVHFLVNASEMISVRGIPMQITGLEIDRTYYDRFHKQSMKASYIEELVGHPDSHAVSILLAHNPVYLDAYRDWGADLTLCGHNHGGIVRIGKHRGLISPSLHLFADQCYGRFDDPEKEITAIIGAGLGEHTLPIRIHNPRELVIVDFVVKKFGQDCTVYK